MTEADTDMFTHEQTWQHFTTLLKFSVIGLTLFGAAWVAVGLWG